VGLEQSVESGTEGRVIRAGLVQKGGTSWAGFQLQGGSEEGFLALSCGTFVWTTIVHLITSAPSG
jgi:hypothetical protein